MPQLEVGELYTFERPYVGELYWYRHSIISFPQPDGLSYEIDFSKPCLLLAVDTNNPNMVTLLCRDEEDNTRELYLHIRFDLRASPKKVVSAKP